jgi:hypothetical protein
MITFKKKAKRQDMLVNRFTGHKLYLEPRSKKDTRPDNMLLVVDVLRIEPRKTHLIDTVNHVPLDSKNNLRTTVISVKTVKY